VAIQPRTEPTFFVRVLTDAKGTQRVDLSERVLSFSYEDCENQVDKLELTVNNWDLSAFDDPVWKKGNILEVAWGYPGDMSPTRQVVIQKVTGFQELKIEALARSILMHKVARIHTFENMRRSDVVRQIATENGYGPNLQDIEETKRVLQHIPQAAMTDWQFLSWLARDEGFLLYIDDLGLHFHKRRLGQRPIRTLRWFTPPEVGEILSIDIENDVTAKPGAVDVHAYDQLSKTKIVARGSNSKTKRDTLRPVVELIDETGIGPTVKFLANAAQTFNPSAGGSAGKNVPRNIAEETPPSAVASPSLANGAAAVNPQQPSKPAPQPNKPGTIVRFLGGTALEVGSLLRNVAETIHPSAHADTAQTTADALYLRAQHLTVELTATVVGDPNLLAKTNIEIQGIGQRLSGKYHVKEAKHKIDSGYTVELKCSSDGTSEVGGVESEGVLNRQRVADNKILLPLAHIVADTINTGKTALGFFDTRGRDMPGQDKKKGGG
jgi:phage protein D